MQYAAHLERSVVCAVCVVKKKVRFAGEFHPHRLRRGIVSLRDAQGRKRTVQRRAHAILRGHVSGGTAAVVGGARR